MDIKKLLAKTKYVLLGMIIYSSNTFAAAQNYTGQFSWSPVQNLTALVDDITTFFPKLITIIIIGIIVLIVIKFGSAIEGLLDFGNLRKIGKGK